MLTPMGRLMGSEGAATRTLFSRLRVRRVGPAGDQKPVLAPTSRTSGRLLLLQVLLVPHCEGAMHSTHCPPVEQ
jgi:hypothetical protein